MTNGDERLRSAVLIVEDERVARRAMATLLSSCGYATAVAGSAEEALGLLGRTGAMPDVALVDLDLPGMNGLDLIAQLEKLDPSVFLVLVTSAGGEALAERVGELGVAYMRKPVDFDRLLTVINQNAERH